MNLKQRVEALEAKLLAKEWLTPLVVVNPTVEDDITISQAKAEGRMVVRINVFTGKSQADKLKLS